MTATATIPTNSTFLNDKNLDGRHIAVDDWQECLTTNGLNIGVVAAVHADCYDILGGIRCKGIRASSCLAIPQVGDSVLIFSDLHNHWILAILSSTNKTKFSIEGSEFSINAGKIAMIAKEIHSESDSWSASHNSLRIYASQIVANVISTEWLGKSISAWMDLISCNSRRTMRNVSEIEAVQCGNYDLQVKEAMALSSENAVITSEQLMKIDGDQIHVG